MTIITDELMREMRARAGNYSLMILKVGPNKHMEDAEKVIWEHGCRMYTLRVDGVLPIACPVPDDGAVDGAVSGVGIFNTSVEETKKIMDEDPSVKAGIYVYEVHPCWSFPGDAIPKGV